MWIPNIYSNTVFGTVLFKVYVPIYSIAQIYYSVLSFIYNYNMDLFLNCILMFVAIQVRK